MGGGVHLFTMPVAPPPRVVHRVHPTRALLDTVISKGVTHMYPCGACRMVVGGSIVADAPIPTRDAIGLRDPERCVSARAYPVRVYVERGRGVDRLPINHVARSVLGVDVRGTVALLPPRAA